jgi:hypothetical protein
MGKAVPSNTEVSTLRTIRDDKRTNKTGFLATLREPPALRADRALGKFAEMNVWPGLVEHFFNDPALPAGPLHTATLRTRAGKTIALLCSQGSLAQLLCLGRVDPLAPVSIGECAVRQNDPQHNRSVLTWRARTKNGKLSFHQVTLFKRSTAQDAAAQSSRCVLGATSVLQIKIRGALRLLAVEASSRRIALRLPPADSVSPRDLQGRPPFSIA